MSERRAIPAVGRLLEALGETTLPRPFLSALVRRELASLRKEGDVPDFGKILSRIRAEVARLERSRLQPVINGTGTILHTNFGRAPLAAAAAAALGQIALSYSNLEYDRENGARGKRGAYLERGLALLCGSEAATVVNNCAAALVLVVRHFTRAKPEVVISRGELVQIGGNFRIGEIVITTGGRLREIGATNKTTLEDYDAAIGPDTGLILRVHQSNFFMSGFADAPPNDEIAQLARRRRVPFVADLGSGAVFPTENMGLTEHEPTATETLKLGVDLICFSGDKIFGGPQAGIIVGKARRIAALKREPLFRALRCDKLILAALQTTMEAHLRKEWPAIPALALLQISPEQLRVRGEELIEQLVSLPLRLRLVESETEVGGGALPRSRIASIALGLRPERFSPNELAIRLRQGTPAVVGYISGGEVRLDLRTILPAQDELLAGALRTCLERP